VPIAYRIHKSLGLTVVVWDGVVTGDDAEDHARRLFADPDWPPGPRHLLDATTATSVPVTADTTLVDLVADVAETRLIRFALVENTGFAEATKFEEAASARGITHIIVFNDVSTACGWLDIDVAAARSVIDELRRGLRQT